MFWYEDEVRRLEVGNPNMAYEPETVFYGSSSLRMWTTIYDDFKTLKPINLGFGGSTLAACVWFFDRIMKPYHPKRLVVYAGDNDLGDERHPEEVFIYFQQLVAVTTKRYGDMPCYFISLKPSISRWNIIDRFKYTNLIIENEIKSNYPNWHFIDIFSKMIDENGRPKKQYFLEDGLHLSPDGYRLWQQVIDSYINPINS